MSKVSNEVKLLEILSDGEIHNGIKLSNKLEVTKRMIATYIQDLKLAGHYIISIRGRYGGYKLVPKSLEGKDKIHKYQYKVSLNLIYIEHV